MPKPISWSQIYVWEKDPNEYYQKYILGIEEEPNRQMKLGNIIHHALEGLDWQKELITEQFTPNYKRVIEEILKYDFPKLPEREVWLGPKGKFYEETNCSLTGRADGRDRTLNIIAEYKSGANFWTQERVDQHEQITLYCFLEYKETGIIPKCILYSLNTSNGKVKRFETTRTPYQLEQVCTKVRRMVQDLKDRGWWEMRI